MRSISCTALGGNAMESRATKRANSSRGLAVPPTGFRSVENSGEQARGLEEFELVTAFEQSFF